VTDDAYENNDSFAAAYNLGTLTAARTLSSLKLVDSEDWFRFTTNSAGTSASSVSISFTNSQGNLQLALYNSSGALLSTSATTSNSETISLNGRAAGTYYVRVYGNAGATNPNYSLTVIPPTPVAPPPGANGFQITLSMTGLTTSQQAIFNQAAARWQQVIVGDLPSVTYMGQVVDDVLIATSAIAIDGVNGVLGQAGPDAIRSSTRLPYHGYMQFDTADLASMERNGTLLGVVIHEMGHVLGIGTVWANLGLISGAGGSNPLFVGAQATAAYNQIFGTAASGVPVENTGGAGTHDAHWRESIFGSELMTGWINYSGMPLSRVTVASLADMGYTVNMAIADAFTPTSAAVSLARQTSGTSGSSSRAVRTYANLVSADSPLAIPAPINVGVWTTVATRPLEGPRRIAALEMTRVQRRAMEAAIAYEWDRGTLDNDFGGDELYLPSSIAGRDSTAPTMFEAAWDDWALLPSN